MLRLAVIMLTAVIYVTMLTGVAALEAQAAASNLQVGVFMPNPASPDEQLPSVGDLHNFESTIGRQADIFLWYESIGESFYTETFRPMAQEGRIIQLAWEPHDFSLPATDQPDYRLKRITAGYLDNDVRRWARELKSFGYTIYFRPMCEMNGDWVTWGGTVNGNTPDDYIPAWRHIHDIFVQEGATNVKFVWSPNRDGDAASAINTFNTYYPGDAYVDFLSINGYNWGHLYNTPGWTSQWQRFEDVFGPSYDAFTARSGKPVMIAETATTEVGGDKAAWIADMFARLPVRFPRITAVTWFNINKETDWRVESSAASLSAFRSAIAKPDSTPPSVNFTSPAQGSTLGGDANITVDAADNTGVSRVDFYMGDRLMGSSKTAPFSFSLQTISLTDGSYTLTAKAFDGAGNSSSSSVPVYVSNSTVTSYYFGWYDNVNMSTWLIIGNPSQTEQRVAVYIGGNLIGTYTVGAQQRVTPRYSGVANGPVKVVSTTGGELLVSERVICNGSFSELPAVPQAELSSEQMLAWYDEQSPGMKNWVLIANLGNQTAEIDVIIAGEIKGHYSVPAGTSIAPEYPQIMNGPVRVVATNGQPLSVSSRVILNGAFNEVAAKAVSGLTSEYHFTWYDEKSAGMKSWIVVGNQGSQSAEVGIYIAGRLMGLYSVPAGGRVTPDYPNTMDGPVRIVSTNGQPLIVGQRSIYRGSFEEVPGTTSQALTSNQWFAWYDNASAGMNTWVLVGNESQETAEVDIRIGGQVMGHYSIPAGGRVTPLFPGQMNGPVQVVSTAGSPQLVVSQRTTFNNSFDELPGMHLT
ncbi:MAG: Ig-like domain-containing protein [Thermoleophilia bacterium]